MQRVSMRIREEAIRLGVKRIVYGECGHAWRRGYSFLNTLAGPFDFWIKAIRFHSIFVNSLKMRWKKIC